MRILGTEQKNTGHKFSVPNVKKRHCPLTFGQILSSKLVKNNTITFRKQRFRYNNVIAFLLAENYS